jgi:branched-chain amino acid transport system permease protein
MTALAPTALHASPWLLRIAVAAAIFVLLALVPSLAGSYQTMLLAYGLIMAIAALGFNLLFGYTGLLSFGHSAYFGVGAYTVALLVQYFAIRSMELYLLLGLISSAAVSALFGYLCVRHTKIYFGILTLALSQVLWSLALKLYWITGGSDGMRVPRPSLLGGHLIFKGEEFSRFITDYYYYVLILFAICVLVMWVIVHSPFGKALQAIRDNETRARFLGLRIRRFRWLAFLISGTFTGLAGILWVPLNGLTTPDDVLYWPFSGQIVFMTLMGGFGNFSGPIVGGIVFNYLKTYAVAATEYWQFLLGAVLVVLVLLLPTGIVGAAVRLVHRRRQEELP